MDGSYIGKRLVRGAVNAGIDFTSDVPFPEEELEAADVHGLIRQSLFDRLYL